MPEPRRSEVHGFDPVSLVAGLVLLVLGSGYLVQDTSHRGLDGVAVGAVLLVVLGAVGLVTTLRRRP